MKIPRKFKNEGQIPEDFRMLVSGRNTPNSGKTNVVTLFAKLLFIMISHIYTQTTTTKTR